MAENNSSAEHELLRTIEGKKPLPKRVGRGAGSAKAKAINFSEELKKAMGRIQSVKELSLNDINKVLLVAIAAVILAQSAILVRGYNRMGNLPKFDAKDMAEATGEISLMGLPLKDYAYYTDALLGRNIFMEKRVEITATEEEVARPVYVPDISTELRLTGISWSEETGEKFAMVEDLELQITYYLQEEERIKGFTIKDIGFNRVLLEKDGIQMELR